MVIEIVVVSVNKNLIFNIILLVVAIILLVIYMVYVIVDERKKWKQREFFKYTNKYEIEYLLYFDMVKKMKRILLKKKLELFKLSLLCIVRRIFVWKNH